MPTTARKIADLPRKATYQDVLDAPPNMVAQLIDGELYLQSRPAGSHVWASGTLHTALNGKFGDFEDRPGGWVILHEPELHLGENVIVPDIAGWRVENLPEIPATAKFDIVPDWICEVLSPSTRNRDLGPKREISSYQGVGHLWIVSPVARTLQVFELSGGEWLLITTLEGMVAISVPPFENLNVPLSRLWRGHARSRSKGRPKVV